MLNVWKILCLELRYWNSTQLDTNVDFLFSFGSNSAHCLWYHIFVVLLHLLFIFKILCPKLCSGSSSWCVCSNELDVPVLTFFCYTDRKAVVFTVLFP
jgi:protein-S-isoprenylcysteine O-methyltransferase Ste14